MPVRQRLTDILWGVLLPLSVIALWEFVTRERLVSAFLLPPFSRVAERLWTDFASGELLALAGQSFARLVISYVIAVFLGVLLGILMARIRFIRWVLDPLLSIGLPAPKIAFLPIFVLWFGVFDKPKIIMTIVACIFPVIAGTWSGTQGVDKYLVWSAQNLGASRRELLTQVIFPAALPSILTAMQVALPIAFIVVVVTEMLTGGDGLGGSMIEAAKLADATGVFANLIVIGLMGFALLGGLQVTRRKILRWHPEVLQEG